VGSLVKVNSMLVISGIIADLCCPLLDLDFSCLCDTLSELIQNPCCPLLSYSFLARLWEGACEGGCSCVRAEIV